MKKSNNKKKKLPKYWLGTRKPTSLGYQPNYGIGNAQFTSVQGEDLMPEVNAAKRNILPGALNKLQKSATSVVNMLQNTVKSTVPVVSSGVNVGAQMASNLPKIEATNLGANGIRLLGDGSKMEATVLGASGAAPQMAEDVGSAAGSVAGTTGRNVLNTAGKVAGALGAVYGLADMTSQLLHQGDHRSIGQMRNTLATNTYTTAGGNQYTEYSGINANAERQYEDAQRKAKQLNFGISAMGTGASIGGLIGSSVPFLGTAIGAGAGALLGGIASLFGFGDNSDEIEEQMRTLANTTSMQNRQSRSVAENQDIKDQFYSRSGAANGKRPVWTAAGLKNKKATAKVSNGEVIGNFEDGYVSRVPGEKNNKDTKLAALKNSDFVISNKFGLSDYAAQTGDYVGALNMQDILMKQYKNKYKCGKLPKYDWGTLGDYALATLPHLGSYLSNLAQYNRAKTASTYVPQMEIENPQTAAAINQVMSDMIDPREYLNQSNKAYRQALWNIQRNPGLGLGGRMVAADSLNRAKFAQDAETRMKIDQANRSQRNIGAQMRDVMGRDILGKRYDQFWRRHQAAQQANAARENWLAQYNQNMIMAGINGAADLLKMNQFNKSQAYQNKMLDIYQQQVDIDKIKAGINAAQSAPAVSTTPSSSNTTAFQAVPLYTPYVPGTSNYKLSTNPALSYFPDYGRANMPLGYFPDWGRYNLYFNKYAR